MVPFAFARALSDIRASHSMPPMTRSRGRGFHSLASGTHPPSHWSLGSLVSVCAIVPPYHSFWVPWGSGSVYGRTRNQYAGPAQAPPSHLPIILLPPLPLSTLGHRLLATGYWLLGSHAHQQTQAPATHHLLVLIDHLQVKSHQAGPSTRQRAALGNAPPQPNLVARIDGERELPIVDRAEGQRCIDEQPRLPRQPDRQAEHERAVGNTAIEAGFARKGIVSMQAIVVAR